MTTRGQAYLAALNAEMNKIQEDRAEAEQIRQEAKAAGTWGAGKSSATPAATSQTQTTPYSITDMQKLNQQKKKEDAQEKKPEESRSKAKTPSLVKLQREQSKKAYDDYTQSAEYKTKTVEREKQKTMYRLLSGIVDVPMPEEADEKEQQLKAEADYWQSRYEAEENQRVTDANLAELESWSDEDRQALEEYAVNQIDDQNMATEMVGVLPAASQKAAALIAKYGKDKVDKLAESYMWQQNAQFAADVDAAAREEVTGGFWNGVGKSLKTVPLNLVNGVVSTVGQLQGAARRTGQYTTLDPNATGTIGDTYVGAIRDQVGQNIENSGELGWLGNLAYQGAMSAADSFARAKTGLVGNMALAAASSFSQNVSEASRRGATPGQAVALGLTNATVEALSEKIPFDNLIDTAKGGKQAIGQIVKTALAQAGIEATTEEISLVGTVLFEAAILREKSDYNQQIMQAFVNGTPYYEAVNQANKNLLIEAAKTAAVSAISGGLSSAGASAVANMRTAMAQKRQRRTATPEMAQKPQAAPQTEEAAQPEQVPTQQEPPAQVPVQQETATVNDAIKKTMEQLRGTKNQTATNSMAERILSDPEAVRQIQEQTGVEVTGTKAEQRKVVKDMLQQLAGGRTSTQISPEGRAASIMDMVQDAVERARGEDVQQPQSAQQEVPSSTGEGSKAASQENLSDERLEQGTVGAAKSKFKHEVRESGVYANTFANANNADLRAVGEDARAADPNLSQYDVITEEESLEEARLRTGTAQDRYVEHRQLMAKDGWSGADNDTAMRLLTAYRKEGKADRLRELAKKQKEMGTQGGQLSQSFAKYSREDATVAVLDAVEVLEKMGVSDVPKKFWKKGDNEPSRHANVGDPDDYSDTAASRMSNTQQKNTIFSKRHMDKQNFEAWKTSVTKSMLEIANDIEAVPEDDVDAMRGIVRQLAQFRRTTAWFGTQNRLTKNADRILEKMDFDTAKTIAKSQLAMIPDDFRKRSAGETAKTIRIHNMLSALTTTERNTIGNATMGIMDAFSDSTVARAMDVAMSKFTGIRTVGNDLKYGKTYFNAARDAADMAALCVELNIPLASESRYSAGNTRTHTTQGGPLGRFLSAYEKYMKYSLEVTDKFFEGGSTAAVNQSIRDLGAKTGLSEDQISGLAERAGQRRTFKEDRNLSRGAKKIKAGANIMFGVGEVGAGDVLMPFAGVPMDIAQTAVDYSGSGMALGLGEMIDVIKAAKNGDTTIKNKRTGAEMPLEIAQRKAVSDFGRGMTGIGLVALSAAGSAVGAIKVHNSKDWEKKGMEQAQNLDGAQVNLSAIWRGLTGGDSSSDPMEWRSGEDVVIGMDFLEPFNSAMNIGYMVSQEPDFISMVKNYPKYALVGVMEAMMDMPVMTLLSEIQELIESLGETDEEGNPATMDAMGQVAGTIATSVVPSFVRQIAQTIDPNYRDTYDPDPLKQAGNQVIASLPFASKTLPEKYDGFGNVQKRYDDTTTGGKVMGVLNNLFLPDDVEKIGGDDVTDYLSRLSADTGETSMYPEEQAPYKFTLRDEEIELTGEQRAEYQKTYGEKNKELYRELINHPGFRNLPEDLQIAAFEKAKTYATQFAKAAVADYRDVPQESAEDLVKGIVNDSLTSAFTSAFNDMTESWEFDYDASGSVAELDRAYDALKAMPDWEHFKDYEATGRVKAYLDARSYGMSTETFTDLYKTYRDIDAADMDTTAKAHEWVAELETAVDDGVITENQKEQMKENLAFRYTLRAETKNFDTMIEEGLATDSAKTIVDLMAGIKGTGAWDMEKKEYGIREIDRREAIADSGLSQKEIDIAMKAYMTDYDPKDSSPDLSELKYDYIRQEMGLSPKAYTEIYRAYLDNSKKADKIAAIMDLGYDRKTANALYDIYQGNSKEMLVDWYNER